MMLRHPASRLAVGQISIIGRGTLKSGCSADKGLLWCGGRHHHGRVWIADGRSFRASLKSGRDIPNASPPQQELARRPGEPQSVVSELEQGQRRIDCIEFLLIAQTLGAEPVAIFAESAASRTARR
jgi:hypothetical protein